MNVPPKTAFVTLAITDAKGSGQKSALVHKQTSVAPGLHVRFTTKSGHHSEAWFTSANSQKRTWSAVVWYVAY
jgi:hypothetical protein